MRRWLAERLIDRAVDGERTLPRWVRVRLAHDKVLQQYERDAMRMVWRLRRDATGWLGEEDQPGSVVRAEQKFAQKRNWVAVVGTLAALVLVAVSVFALRRLGDEQAMQDRNEQEEAKAAAKELEEGFRSLAQHLADARRPEIAMAMMRPVRAAGRTVGRSLALVDESLAVERKRIADNTRSTVRSIQQRWKASWNEIRLQPLGEDDTDGE